MKKIITLLLLSIPFLTSSLYAKNSPSVAVEISNAVSEKVQLYTFEDVQIIYDTDSQQVYLHNTSAEYSYYLQYTYLGNTANNLNIQYTSVPTGAVSSSRITIVPEKDFYLSSTGSGMRNSTLDVNHINDKLIWQDMTITDRNDVSIGCDLNNQHISDDVNRILMSCVETSLSTSKKL